ncbi:MAG: hypothetical protein HND47_08025 [Chloroflexi bacterium]|nr:hypothetical protein [Chloroflexota bacterium]
MNNSLPPVDVPNAFDIYEDVEYQLYWQSLSRQKLDELEPRHPARITAVARQRYH